MNSLVTQFDQVLKYAADYQIPQTSKRAIVREYLQSKIVSWIYNQKSSNQLVFVGGTSLRLLRGIDRFSEDLDFDNLGLSVTEMDVLINEVLRRFEAENIAVELVTTHRGEKNYYDFRFPSMLYELQISTNDKEKLKIKLDYASMWRGQNKETMLFNRYGQIAQVITNPIDQLIVQKLAAYVQRAQTQPRDIYDVVWLYAQGAKIDMEFASVNHLGDILSKAQEKFSSEGVTQMMKDRLRPFLFETGNLGKLKLFGEVISV